MFLLAFVEKGIPIAISPAPIPAKVQFASPPAMAVPIGHPTKNPPAPPKIEARVLWDWAFLIKSKAY